MKKNIFLLPALAICSYALVTFSIGCAQIGFPTGGPRDSLAPVLTKASPELNKLNFTGNKITFTFNEYIEIQDLQANLLVSPLPKNNPVINSNLKTITIKLKDSLQPNTTYSINFGNAIKDVNEGNILKDFTYTFSTGPTIDSLGFSGNLLLAETGRTDSSLVILLYKNAPDSAVTKRKPDYISKVNGEGRFKFRNLPPALFKIYALKDGDGGKTYNSKTELFAFNDTEINTADTVASITLYAYAEEKAKANNAASSTPAKKTAEKKLRFISNLDQQKQDLQTALEITFNNALRSFDSGKIILSDSNYKRLNATLTLDSTRKKFFINTTWLPETNYYLILPMDALEDSSGNLLTKSDTISFATRKVADYGRLLLRFKNFDAAKKPMLQFLQNDVIKASYPVISPEWSNKMFMPGEYDIRILYDSNNNGIWDPGNYSKKLQPEKAITLPQKLAIRADWDNERDITL